MKKIKLKIINIIFILLLLNSCNVFYLTYYDYDNGKDWKKNGKILRYSYIEIKYYQIEIAKIEIAVDDTYPAMKLNIANRGGPYNHEEKYKDIKVKFLSHKLQFEDGTILQKINDSLNKHGYGDKYSCDRFMKKVRQNKYIYYETEYIVDSLGIKTIYKKKYKLRKKYYMRSIHL